MSFTASLGDIVTENANGLLGDGGGRWPRVPLAQVARIQNGFPFPSTQFDRENGMPLIRIRDIDCDTTEVRFRGAYDDAFVVSAGDLLVGMDGDFHAHTWRGPAGLLNQRVCRVIPIGETIDRRYLAHVLPGYLAAINEKTSSITVKHLSSRTIAAIPIPLPPQAEQKRIAAMLDEHISDIDAATRSLERAVVNAARIQSAIMYAAVHGTLLRGLSSYSEWSSHTIGEVAIVGSGTTPARSKSYYYANGDVPWVTSGALNAVHVQQPSEYVTQRALRETSLRIYPPGTLLVAMYGEGKTRGKCSELAIAAAVNQAIAAIQMLPAWADSQPFVKLFLRSAYEEMRRSASGGVQPNLNLGLVRGVPLRLPALDVQREIVQEAESRQAVAERVVVAVEAQIVRARRLRRSILASLLSGVSGISHATLGHNES